MAGPTAQADCGLILFGTLISTPGRIAVCGLILLALQSAHWASLASSVFACRPGGLEVLWMNNTLTSTVVDRTSRIQNQPARGHATRQQNNLPQHSFLVHLSAFFPCCPAAYQLPAIGRDGSVRPFEKPWFMVLLMFAGRHIALQQLPSWVFGLDLMGDAMPTRTRRRLPVA